MNNQTAVTIQTIAVCATIGFAFYCIFGLWFGSLIAGWHEDEVLKHETCYTSYRFIESLQQNVVSYSYCGGNE